MPPITVNWFDEQHTLLRMDFHGPATWAEVIDAGREITALLDAEQQDTVDLIVDLTRGNFLPLGGIMEAARNLTEFPARRQGAIVVVGLEGAIGELYRLFLSVYRQLKRSDMKFYRAETLKEAITLIDQARDRRPTNQ